MPQPQRKPKPKAPSKAADKGAEQPVPVVGVSAKDYRILASNVFAEPVARLDGNTKVEGTRLNRCKMTTNLVASIQSFEAAIAAKRDGRKKAATPQLVPMTLDPGTIIVIDNAAAHKLRELKQIWAQIR